MTLPNGAAGLATKGLEFAFTGTDGSIPGAPDRNRPNIENVLKADIFGSQGWQGAHTIAFFGLPVDVPLFLGQAMKMAQSLTGFPIADWGEPVLDKITDVFDMIGTFASRLTGMFPSLDFIAEGAWNVVDKISDWLQNDILSLGFIPELVGGFIDIFQIPGLDASKIISGEFAMDIIDGLGDALDDLWSNAQNILESVFEGIMGFVNPITTAFDHIVDIFKRIPFFNILGIGGPANIGAALQNTWDQLIGGLVGEPGTSAGLSDLYNIGQDISTRASLGQFSWDILGIRNNKSFSEGMLATSTASIPLTQVALQASAPTFPLTQSTAITLYERVQESAMLGVVRWMGSGTTNVTDFYVNIYKMDPLTGDRTLVHASPNIIANVSAPMSTNKYELAAPIQREPGEIFGYELAMRGAGTHTVVGQTTWLHDDPDVYPRRMSSVRNSGVAAPPASISHASTVYSANVPFMEFGVATDGVEIPHSPELRTFYLPGTTLTPIPAWVNRIEVIALGAGGGGHQGGTWGVSGEGGDAGDWAVDTWVRGVDFTNADLTVSVTVGEGGNGATAGAGADGEDTVVTVGSSTVTAPGGNGGDSYVGVGVGTQGKSPGNQTYEGQTYVGGGIQGNPGATGAAPGGGGGGGNPVNFGHGGKGASGTLFLRLCQD